MPAILRGDHHVHSTFSDDAVSTPAENLAAARAAGLTELSLVDHVRRDTAWVADFVRTVRGLEVPEGLVVNVGVEAKILDRDGELDMPPLPVGVDRILIADHQFPAAEGPLGPTEVRRRIAEGWAVDDVLDDYVTGLIAAMRRHPGNQLAHCFSLLPKLDIDPALVGAERLARWADAARQTDTVVEVNEKWACPAPDALAAARRAGVALVAATDSHAAEDVGRYRRVPVLLAAIDEETGDPA
ncbi:PHP domain-containing protein [uncultured Microbacterium sp.]|uniref:PHP domain-containing protein n=1 Tax=uncultured Microbacterium sp. TaxID=191216 RepID=UPI0025F6F382|nr:PHP domain-containing protein [uncultured Microbacterium sp.]